jgi:hypothetical protein
MHIPASTSWTALVLFILVALAPILWITWWRVADLFAAPTGPAGPAKTAAIAGRRQQVS